MIAVIAEEGEDWQAVAAAPLDSDAPAAPPQADSTPGFINCALSINPLKKVLLK